MSKLEYMILETDKTKNFLEMLVNEAIEEGWVPQGGVCRTDFDIASDGLRYMQAMIRRRD